MSEHRTIEQRLSAELRGFDLSRALRLSSEIHEFEATGGELTRREDRLWERLTVRIESRCKCHDSVLQCPVHPEET